MTKRKVVGYSCVGIDACKGKWLAVCISDNGFEVGKFDTIGDVCKSYLDCDTYLIDIPIGLPEGKDDVRPDMLVKRELGRKGSSIFPVPCRQAVYTDDKARARELNISALGKSLSEQSLGISKAIRQVDEFLQANPEWKNRLLESHPELCFSKLSGNQPIMENKTTAEGRNKRMEVLRRHYPAGDKVIEKFLADGPNRKKTDDVVDALCLAVMGRLIVENGCRRFPEKPMMDSKGLLMQIVYGEENKMTEKTESSNNANKEYVAESGARRELSLGKKYRHFKGKEYLVMHIAKDSETLQEMVVYQALYGEYGIWVRPLDMFLEQVEVDGKKVYRFEEIVE